ncbi:MAG: hypothetical protein AAF974_03455 [Cyanobacteria bacterium P01_E01_bin.34]
MESAVSVCLDLKNGQVRRIENTEPYALFGDIKQDHFAGGVIPVGNNILSLELYSQDKGQGSLIGSVQIDFSIG